MEENRSICRNPWCKATFFYTEKDMIEDPSNDNRTSKIDDVLSENTKIPPMQCPKCRSFNEDLSGGVEWKEKKYEGSRMDGMPHHIGIKVKKFS